MSLSGTQFKALRTALRYTQEEMAVWFGVRARQVRRWEQGGRMNWLHEARLAELLTKEWVRRRLQDAGLTTTDQQGAA